MITRSPYCIGSVIKPGHMPEPITEPIHTCDPPEVIAICLDCHVRGGCRPDSSECRLNNQHEVTHKPETLERDEKLLYLLTHGWRNTECICEELGIGPKALSAAKKRLRGRGVIP